MKRVLGALAIAAALVSVPAGASAADVPQFGGQCDGVVDLFCRQYPCGEDELDCGLIPPCVLWVAGVCLL